MQATGRQLVARAHKQRLRLDRLQVLVLLVAHVAVLVAVARLQVHPDLFVVGQCDLIEHYQGFLDCLELNHGVLLDAVHPKRFCPTTR